MLADLSSIKKILSYLKTTDHEKSEKAVAEFRNLVSETCDHRLVKKSMFIVEILQ